MKIFGKNIEYLLKKLKVSKSKFAQIIEVQPSTVTKMINGSTFPQRQNFEKILSFFEISEDEIIYTDLEAEDYKQKLYSSTSENKRNAHIPAKFHSWLTAVSINHEEFAKFIGLNNINELYNLIDHNKYDLETVARLQEAGLDVSWLVSEDYSINNSFLDNKYGKKLRKRYNNNKKNVNSAAAGLIIFDD